jgi:hypothetical protein
MRHYLATGGHPGWSRPLRSNTHPEHVLIVWRYYNALNEPRLYSPRYQVKVVFRALQQQLLILSQYAQVAPHSFFLSHHTQHAARTPFPSSLIVFYITAQLLPGHRARYVLPFASHQLLCSVLVLYIMYSVRCVCLHKFVCRLHETVCFILCNCLCVL